MTTPKIWLEEDEELVIPHLPGLSAEQDFDTWVAMKHLGMLEGDGIVYDAETDRFRLEQGEPRNYATDEFRLDATVEEVDNASQALGTAW
jgi:hypothetical protein